MSYSAVLKNLASETTKPKNAAAGGKPPNLSKTFSRPPPGFSPLPTHGGDTEMRMTVLSTKSKTKQTAAASGAPRNNPTRADSSMNWRNDEQSTQSSTQHQQQQHRANNSAQSGQAVKWQRSDESSQSKAHRTAPIKESGRGRDTPNKPTDYSSSDDSSEPPTAPVQPHRVFGPGGLKACVICGSKDHLRCNDRSKLFFWRTKLRKNAEDAVSTYRIFNGDFFYVWVCCCQISNLLMCLMTPTVCVLLIFAR